jgi:hypothetical protein
LEVESGDGEGEWGINSDESRMSEVIPFLKNPFSLAKPAVY